MAYTFAQEMKKLILITVCLLTSFLASSAGSPFILTETEACAQADLVVVATIGKFSDIPGDGSNPFDPDVSKWHELGFRKSGSAEVKETLLGKSPTKLMIYGGQLGFNMFYRLRKPGIYLLLLKQVEGNAYRPADSTYSFMPVVDGKVGWLVDVPESKRIWITPAEALKRINDNKTKANKP